MWERGVIYNTQTTNTKIKLCIYVDNTVTVLREVCISYWMYFFWIVFIAADFSNGSLVGNMAYSFFWWFFTSGTHITSCGMELLHIPMFLIRCWRCCLSRLLPLHEKKECAGCIYKRIEKSENPCCNVCSVVSVMTERVIVQATSGTFQLDNHGDEIKYNRRGCHQEFRDEPW